MICSRTAWTLRASIDGSGALTFAMGDEQWSVERSPDPLLAGVAGCACQQHRRLERTGGMRGHVAGDVGTDGQGTVRPMAALLHAWVPPTMACVDAVAAD